MKDSKLWKHGWTSAIEEPVFTVVTDACLSDVAKGQEMLDWCERTRNGKEVLSRLAISRYPLTWERTVSGA